MDMPLFYKPYVLSYKPKMPLAKNSEHQPKMNSLPQK